MNIFPVLSFILLLAVGTVAVGCKPKTLANNPVATDGNIELLNKEGETDCTLDFVTAQHRLGQGNGCRNDYAYRFRLNNVPSAATLILADAGDCGEDENFYFEFKTIKYETSTDAIVLTEVTTFDEGAVVRPGLRLIKKIWNGKDSIEGKLTCVKIIRSE